MSPTGFKVIVVGGGLVGLVAAHALSRAGLDFVVLESRPSIVLDAGSNLVINPMGLRVLGQLGLLPAFDAVSSPLAQIERRDHNGKDLGTSQAFVHINENHGRSLRAVSRHDLTAVLYDSLPDESKAKMFANKRVSNISIIDDGIRFPTQDDLHPGDANETHGRDVAVQLFAGEDTTVIGIYERMDKPTRERIRYSTADEEALVGRWGHLPISRGLTIRDAYNARVGDGRGAGMINLEEGVVQHWSHAGRIVLAGDAAHKFTPSTGAGCNNGIVDVVTLSNELANMFRSIGGVHSIPTTAQLSAAFKAYQDTRFDAVIAGCVGSGQVTAMVTWQGQLVKFVDRYVISNRTIEKCIYSRAAAGIAKTPVSDYINGEEELNGKVPWTQPMTSSDFAVIY
ncbi:hypothetical protein THAR02_07520 [Trichoderma harzianum]|uniref:FAD-binding domain-containing protein n=1 Tax=Trichoderma harzianum TaxID=5544 RepID=A0A0F9X5A7_TRIHA|nr:hypothetical protein THAR02_07520 [Trichoderma harzianum]